MNVLQQYESYASNNIRLYKNKSVVDGLTMNQPRSTAASRNKFYSTCKNEAYESAPV